MTSILRARGHWLAQLFILTSQSTMAGRGGGDRTLDVSNVLNFKFSVSQPAAPRLHILLMKFINVAQTF